MSISIDWKTESFSDVNVGGEIDSKTVSVCHDFKGKINSKTQYLGFYLVAILKKNGRESLRQKDTLPFWLTGAQCAQKIQRETTHVFPNDKRSRSQRRVKPPSHSLIVLNLFALLFCWKFVLKTNKNVHLPEARRPSPAVESSPGRCWRWGWRTDLFLNENTQFPFPEIIWL